MKRFVLALTLFLAATVASAQLPPIVQSAFDKLDTSSEENWAYTKTSVEGGKKTVETFDPSRPEGQRWQLVLKDGRTPTKDDLAEYAKHNEKRKQKGKKNDKDNFSEMIRPGSLRVVRETPAEIVYDFRLPLEGKGDDMEREIADSMKGRLTIVKSGEWLQSLEIDNEKPIKPVIGVRIDTMHTKLTFNPPVAGVPPLISQVRATIKGKIALLKTLDTDQVSTYTDYRKVR